MAAPGNQDFVHYSVLKQRCMPPFQQNGQLIKGTGYILLAQFHSRGRLSQQCWFIE